MILKGPQGLQNKALARWLWLCLGFRGLGFRHDLLLGASFRSEVVLGFRVWVYDFNSGSGCLLRNRQPQGCLC